MQCLVCVNKDGSKPEIEVVRALCCELTEDGAIVVGSTMVVDEYTVCVNCDSDSCVGQDCTPWEWQEDAVGERRVHLTADEVDN